MSVQHQKYRHVNQPEGEVHALPLKTEDEEVHAVGTSGCRTCMCIYLRLENNSVFVAHMVAQSGRPSHLRTKGYIEAFKNHIDVRGRYDCYPFEWTSNRERGHKLKRKVLAQLQSTLPPGSRAKNPLDAFIVCPALYLDGRYSNGWWMREAVQDFFDLEKGIPVHRAHGFVAGPSMDTVLFQWTGAEMEGGQHMSKFLNERSPESYQWTACSDTQEQKKLFGFLHDGIKWHKWGRWNL